MRVEASPNTDGGHYAWRCLSVEVAAPVAAEVARPAATAPTIVQPRPAIAPVRPIWGKRAPSPGRIAPVGRGRGVFQARGPRPMAAAGFHSHSSKRELSPVDASMLKQYPLSGNRAGEGLLIQRNGAASQL